MTVTEQTRVGLYLRVFKLQHNTDGQLRMKG